MSCRVASLHASPRVGRNRGWPILPTPGPTKHWPLAPPSGSNLHGSAPVCPVRSAVGRMAGPRRIWLLLPRCGVRPKREWSGLGWPGCPILPSNSLESTASARSASHPALRPPCSSKAVARGRRTPKRYRARVGASRAWGMGHGAWGMGLGAGSWKLGARVVVSASRRNRPASGGCARWPSQGKGKPP